MTRLWYGDQQTLPGQLILLTDQSIVVATPDEEDLPSVCERLRSGDSPWKALRGHFDDIPFRSVTRVSAGRHEHDVEIQYSSNGQTFATTLRLVSKKIRDEVYAALRSVFENKLRDARDSYSVTRAVIGSLLSFSIVAAITWIGARAAAALREAGDYETEGRYAGTKALAAWVLETLGPLGVTAIGGSICLLSAIMLAVRVRRPHIMLIMRQEPYKPDSTAGLVGKFIVLFFMWYLAARVAI